MTVTSVRPPRRRRRVGTQMCDEPKSSCASEEPGSLRGRDGVKAASDVSSAFAVKGANQADGTRPSACEVEVRGGGARRRRAPCTARPVVPRQLQHHRWPPACVAQGASALLVAARAPCRRQRLATAGQAAPRRRRRARGASGMAARSRGELGALQNSGAGPGRRAACPRFATRRAACWTPRARVTLVRRPQHLKTEFYYTG